MSDPVPPVEFLAPVTPDEAEDAQDGLFDLPPVPDPTQAPPHP